MVDAVSANNENKKSNTGKWVGAGAGAAVGAYKVYDVSRNLRQVDEFLASDAGKALDNCGNLDAIKTVINESNMEKKIKIRIGKVMDETIKLYGDSKEAVKPFVEGFNKGTKLLKNKPAIILGVACFTLLGLGLGAIVDAIRNRSNKD